MKESKVQVFKKSKPESMCYVLIFVLLLGTWTAAILSFFQFRRSHFPDPQGENDENFTVFSYSELKLATRGFSAANKIGEGAFGCVYKGLLANGSIVAVKMLSIELESMRGEREFVSEISTLTNLKHENLVTLKGCCIDGAKRLLVYNYMENNSLAQILLAPMLQAHLTVANGISCKWQMR
ncbi:hypothetical protein V6N12_030775 [Hibiscus sabdariffa]|uniref:Protein kinase domain-containing protein n=1 Tax=Hibiscus sabdariffa TaxID=183260 RepID=A0ABR2E6Y0_9ROSI